MKKHYLILIAIFVLVIAGCKEIESIDSENKTDSDPRVRGIDYDYCNELGYRYEQRGQGDDAEEYCIFPNGEECVAFDFITGECHREFTLCEQQGHIMRIGLEQHESFNLTYGICIFEDGSYCKEADFFRGNCHVKWG